MPAAFSGSSSHSPASSAPASARPTLVFFLEDQGFHHAVEGDALFVGEVLTALPVFSLSSFASCFLDAALRRLPLELRPLRELRRLAILAGLCFCWLVELNVRCIVGDCTAAVTRPEGARAAVNTSA